MKEGVFEETVEILEDYVPRESYVIPASTSPTKRPPMKIKIRLDSKEEQRPAITPFLTRRPEEEEEGEEQGENDTLVDYCRRNSSGLVYKKFVNEGFNRVYSQEYAASLFLYIERTRAWKQHGERLTSLEDLLANTLKLEVARSDQQTRLISFDSNFQSGNLLAAYKVAHNEYDLVLQNDINSKGNLQWFYFGVSVQYPMELRFNIINLLKYDSLFNYGMQIAVFSQKKHRKTGEGWTRAGKKILYQRSQLFVENQPRKHYYSLTFTYDFKSQDKVYFAHSFPYTYSRLNQLLMGILSNPIKAKGCRREIIGTTTMNLNIECLTLSEDRPPAQDNRKAIVLMARQHPGETVGSWVMEGFIEQMLKRSRQTDYIRKHYVVKVLPMVNPDGVVLGNYRSNLSGCDMNRNWHTQKKPLYPQIVTIRNYLAELARERRVKIVIDVHGHSKKMQTFYYGNSHFSPQVPRLFPFIASKLSTDVNFDECTFTNSEDRRNTARMALAAILNTPLVYTYECSFFGGLTKAAKRYSYGIDDYKRLGAELVTALYEYCNEESELHKKLAKELSSSLKLLKVGEQSDCSQSDPEKCDLKEEERQAIREIALTERISTLPSQRNIRTMSMRRERNTARCVKPDSGSTVMASARTSNPHTEALLHRKQLQRILQFRQTMDQFEKRIMCSRLEQRPETADKQTQTDPQLEVPSTVQKPQRSRVIRNSGSKLVFSIEIKKDRRQISELIRVSSRAAKPVSRTKNASRNFASRATQTIQTRIVRQPRRQSILICETISRPGSMRPQSRTQQY